MLTGTPDKWKVVGDTLRVIDGKTVSKSGDGKAKPRGLNQVMLYAFYILTNTGNPGDKVSLEIEVYVRDNNKTVEEVIAEPFKVFEMKLSVKELKTKARAYLKTLVGGYHILPFKRGCVSPSRQGGYTGGNINSFCRTCRVALTDKKYKTGPYYLCNMCFYTSATEAEFQEKSKELLRLLKKGILNEV